MTAYSQRIQNLYLARHGQTALNAEGRLRGLANPPLDDVGIAEADRLALVLAGKQASLIVSSPLERARRTAEIIANIAGIPLLLDDRFNDRDYGPQTGQIKAEVEAKYGSVDDAPGVEPTSSVLDRARPALDALLDENTPHDVIVVTHDAIIRPLVASIDPILRPEAPTASWNHLQRADQAWKILAIDQKPTSA